MFKPLAKLLIGASLTLTCCQSIAPEHEIAPTSSETPAPLYYHIFVRSFADSNGNQNGDLQGIIDSLDYLQSLGVTGLLLTPLYPSQFYHNYFADDFYGIDPEFGDMDIYLALVEALKQRDMTLILDQEIQYVSGKHDWYKNALGNPTSEFDGFALFSDDANEQPVGTLFGRTDFKVWPNQDQTIVTVDMLNPEVHDYFQDYLLFWMDPNGDGDFSDGVDGYRIDHMMDDLDNMGVLTGLFETFWVPIFDELRAKNPDIVIVAEQYDWGYGEAFLNEGNADMVFSFPVWNAVNALDASEFAESLKQTNKVVTHDHNQFVFIENHDTNRFASVVHQNPEILKLGAALNLLSGWTPIIYYGQEIGMSGEKAEGETAATKLADSIDDARDIPVRQAFRWHPNYQDGTLATWYRSDPQAYPFEDSTRPGDGVSVEEQDSDPESLLNTYRALSALRQTHPALALGSTEVVTHTDNSVVFRRSLPSEDIIVAVNFSDAPASAKWSSSDRLNRIYGDAETMSEGSFVEIVLSAFDVSVWHIQQD